MGVRRYQESRPDSDGGGSRIYGRGPVEGNAIRVASKHSGPGCVLQRTAVDGNSRLALPSPCPTRRLSPRSVSVLARALVAAHRITRIERIVIDCAASKARDFAKVLLGAHQQRSHPAHVGGATCTTGSWPRNSCRKPGHEPADSTLASPNPDPHTAGARAACIVRRSS